MTGYQDTAFGNDLRPTDIHAFTAAMQKSVKTHFLKAGMEFRAYRENSISHQPRPDRPVQFRRHLDQGTARQRYGRSGEHRPVRCVAAARNTIVLQHLRRAQRQLRRAVHFVGLLPPGRLEGHAQADREHGPAVGVRGAADRAVQQERAQLRSQGRPAVRSAGAGQLRQQPYSRSPRLPVRRPRAG